MSSIKNNDTLVIRDSENVKQDYYFCLEFKANPERNSQIWNKLYEIWQAKRFRILGYNPNKRRRKFN